MEADGIEIEVERSEEEIRSDKLYNVKEYFDSKKSGTDFTPIDVKTTKRVPLRREIPRSFDKVEQFIKDKDAYSQDTSEAMGRIETLMKLFLR